MVKQKFCTDCQYCMNPKGVDSLCDAPKNWTTKVVKNRFWLVKKFQPPTLSEMGWLDSIIEKSCGKRGRWFLPKDTDY